MKFSNESETKYLILNKKIHDVFHEEKISPLESMIFVTNLLASMLHTMHAQTRAPRYELMKTAMKAMNEIWDDLDQQFEKPEVH